MFLHHLVEFGNAPWMVLNHHWHGINVLSILEFTLIAAAFFSILGLLGALARESKRFIAISAAAALSFSTVAYAANTTLGNLSASGALAGANLIYVVQTIGSGGVKATMTQVATFINSLFSGDFTCTSGGACTLKNTGPGATGPIGNGTTIPVVTIDAQGRTTALTSVAVTPTPQGNLTGDVTSVGLATTLTNAPVIAKVLTGYTSGAGTVSAADSILSAIQKLNGNAGLLAPLASPTFTGVPAAPTATVGTNTTQLATTAFVIANAGSTTFANPTGTAGPTANNGVATTAMRSDATPAVQKATNAQFGIMEGDGSSITCVAGVCSATTGGGGTVTSVSAGCGTSTGGSPITTTGTVTAALTARTNTANSGVGADFVSTDCGGIVYDNSASSIAVSLPVATTSGFGANTFFARCNINTGVSTITPVTSTIGGAATLVVGAGTAAKPTCVYFRSDGTNYSLTETPLGTAATQNTGTSGATLPLLNGTNTFSGAQTFGSVFGSVSTQAGTTYTLQASDCGTEIAFTNAAAVTVTIPAALTTGCNIVILQTTSAGQVTVTGTAVSAATLHSAHSYTKTFGQWAAIGINIYTTGVAILTGDGA